MDCPPDFCQTSQIVQLILREPNDRKRTEECESRVEDGRLFGGSLALDFLGLITLTLRFAKPGASLRILADHLFP